LRLVDFGYRNRLPGLIFTNYNSRKHKYLLAVINSKIRSCQLTSRTSDKPFNDIF
jgi:hypothetical protein